MASANIREFLVIGGAWDIREALVKVIIVVTSNYFPNHGNIVHHPLWTFQAKEEGRTSTLYWFINMPDQSRAMHDEPCHKISLWKLYLRVWSVTGHLQVSLPFLPRQDGLTSTESLRHSSQPMLDVAYHCGEKAQWTFENQLHRQEQRYRQHVFPRSWGNNTLL